VQPRQAQGRYKGRRRVPQPPRSRYAAVVTTAVVGAGIVALGAGAAIPDLSSSDTPYISAGDPTLAALTVEDRQAALDRANRSQERKGPATTMEQAAPDVWMLPLRNDYILTTLYEMRWGEMHLGLDMSAGYGTPIYAAHAGTVILSRYNGGYGYNVQIDHGDGVITIYGHASKLIVQEGQRVEAGQVIALIGNTGYSFGYHLHYEVHVNGSAVDPIPFMMGRGVDIPRRVEAVSGGIVIS
jgi:murein DD-endopeptidase MepM/ murein hydrolase activator NlpD